MEFFSLKSSLLLFINTHKSVSIFVAFYKRIDCSSEKYGLVTSKLQSRNSSLYLLTPILCSFHVTMSGTSATLTMPVFNSRFIEDAAVGIAYDHFLYWPLFKSWGHRSQSKTHWVTCCVEIIYWGLGILLSNNLNLCEFKTLE